MNEQGSFIATLLDSSRKAYAAGAVVRLRESTPELAAFVQSLGFHELVEDAQVRLMHLAEGLACGRPELFAQDAEWLRATYAARELPPTLLEASLAALAEELEESLPADSAAAVRVFFEAARARLSQPLAPVPSLLEGDPPHVDLARRFLAAVLEGDAGAAEVLIDQALEAGVTIADLHAHVITRVQSEVGRMWQVGEIHIAEEHLGSRIVEDVLARLRASIPHPAQAGHSVLIASVAGNQHDIGARMVADHFRMSGWRCIFLGADMPTADLVQVVADFRPEVVALSVGLVLNVRSAAAAIGALRAAHPGTPILVGGRPFAQIETLWSDVGADGCAVDAPRAVQAALALLGKA